MPKKLPLFWPQDANCNKLTSKPLRVLRDRPNKLNSRPRSISTLCDSYNKTKHLKSEQKKTFRSVEEFHGFLTSETVLSRHSRSQPRQILHSNDIHRSKTLQTLNSNTSWKQKYSNTMAVDFDHMYIECQDSKISIGRDIEFQHLKELNLLHLDFIQQQAEQLISKDKIIKALKEENKNLRARLERIDRRVSLSLQKKSSGLSPISIQTDFSNDLSFPFSIKSESSPRSVGQKSPLSVRSLPLRNSDEKSPPPRNIRDEELYLDTPTSKRDSLRKLSPRQVVSNSTLSPIPHVPRASPRDKRAKNQKDAIPTTIAIEVNSEHESLSAISPASLEARKTRSPTIKRTLIEEIHPQKKNKSVEPPEKDMLPLSPFKEDGMTDHSLRSRNKSKESHEELLENHLPKVSEPDSSLGHTENDFSLPVSEEKQSLSSSNSVTGDNIKWRQGFKGVETRKVRGKGILTTGDSYYILSHTSSGNLFEISDNEDLNQVEIPKWRIKVLTSLYVMEGTENLEDEVFLKRHAKPEQDERKRKRWDLQRMREQRQYEKLLERYQGRNNPHGTSTDSHQSLWPNPEAAQTLQIDHLLPVCAFGQPLAQISESDFFVPWLVERSPLPVGLCTRRRKR